MTTLSPRALALRNRCAGLALRPEEWEVVAQAVEGMVAHSLSPSGAVCAEIVSERERQVSAEGWTQEHDDGHGERELVSAALCYAVSATLPYSEKKRPWRRILFRGHEVIANEFIASNWPWDRKWWKPTNRRRDLVKASALIVAEIERLDRAADREEIANG